MKKIIAIGFLTSVFATSYAQVYYSHNSEDRNGQYATTLGKEYYTDGNYFSARERDFEIARINREFKMKVYSIKRDRYMPHRQKKLAIRSAEYEKDRQIQLVNSRFYPQRHHESSRRY